MSTGASSAESGPSRPAFSALSRQHSRSSSQLATLASLSLTPSVSPRRPRTSTNGDAAQRQYSPSSSGHNSPVRRLTGNGLGFTESTALGEYGSGLQLHSASMMRTGSSSEEENDGRRSSDEDDDGPDWADGIHLRTGRGTQRFNGGKGKSRDSSTDREPITDEPPTFSTLTPEEAELVPPTTGRVAAAAAESSFGADTSPSLAQFIQQKRRQASAPYLASARSQSLFSPGPGFGISALSATHSGSGPSGYVGGWGSSAGSVSGHNSPQQQQQSAPAPAPPHYMDEVRRARSRVSSRRGTVGSLRIEPNSFLVPTDFSEPGMVMTPTTEEWRQLGGTLSALADSRARDEARLKHEKRNGTRSPPNGLTDGPASNPISSSSSSSSLDKAPDAPAYSLTSFATVKLTPPAASSLKLSDPPTPPPELYRSSFSYQTSRSGFTHHSHSPAHSISLSSCVDDDDKRGNDTVPYTDPLPSTATFKPTHRSQLSESSLAPPRPNLSRGSLSVATTGTPTEGSGTPISTDPETVSRDPFDTVTTFVPPSPQLPPPSPVKLNDTHNLGPVDPRSYSAVTGLRSIENFAIESEAGKGAYGTVVKAREKGPDGQPVGPQLVIKYIIKQRILADCWKKHKILGPIPIEVHVLDHLRRVPYMARPPGRRKPGGGGFMKPVGMGQRRDSAPSLKEGTLTGHPNICGMLDFFEDGEFYYLVMPQAGVDPDNPPAPGGQDLFDYVDVHPDGLAPSVVRRIFSQVVDAVYFLHEHSIVHRDIKDENVVLDHHGNVQLIDFGSAAYVKDGKKFDTFSGTLDFAAPEVLRGARYGGKEQDVWALGVLGYVLICGECPFWSPDEAMRGLVEGSRAYQSLRNKLVAHTRTPRPTSSSTSSSSSSSSSFSTSTTDPNRVRSSSISSSSWADLDNAIDLVSRCLEVDPADRPTADLICDHRFLFKTGSGATSLTGPEAANYGWRGYRGWERDVDVETELI